MDERSLLPLLLLALFPNLAACPSFSSPPKDATVSAADGFEMLDGQLYPDAGPGCVHPAVVMSCTSGFCKIPAGCFLMGSPVFEECRGEGEVLHKVTLTRGFEISQREITQSQYQTLMGSLPSAHKTCTDCPVESVTWYQAAAYCNALSAQRSLPSCYTCNGTGEDLECHAAAAYGASILACPGYRLPVEAEWEYSCRAGKGTPFHNGFITDCHGLDPNADQIAWFKDNSGGSTHMVGTKQANGWGLFDMSGNVWEWIHDSDQGNEPSTPQTDPVGPVLPAPVIRGGAFDSMARGTRCANRNAQSPGDAYNYLGFRVVRTLL